MTKIVLCCMNYKPEIIAIGKYTSELCEYLSKSGHDVEVITAAPHYPGWRVFRGYASFKYSYEIINGVKVWRVPIYLNSGATGLARLAMPLSWSLMATPVLWWRALLKRPKLIIAVQPTIMLAPSVLVAAWLSKAKTVQHVQDLEIDAALAVGHIRANNRLIRLAYAAERFIMRRFDRVVTISLKMRDQLIRKGLLPKRIVVIRNWVDTREITPLGRPSVYRKELDIPPDVFVIQYSGQMGRKQALHLILRAAANLAHDARFMFVLAGDGPLRAAIAEEAATLPNLMLLPLQPADRLGEFLNLADCHILTQEAGVSELVLPSKLGGMLASGRRMLITADKGSELANFLGAAATLTPPGDVDAIVRALILMASTPDETAALRAERANELEATALLPLFELALAAA